MPYFPPELHARLALAIHKYAESRASTADAAELKAVIDPVCRHAHASGMLPETMVIALRHSYNSLASSANVSQANLRDAYDILLSGCLAAYFAPRLPDDEQPSDAA